MKNSQTTVMLHQQTGKQSRTRFPDSRQNLKIWRVKNNKGKPPKWKPMSNCGPSKRNSADSKTEWIDWKRSWIAIHISQVPGVALGLWAGRAKGTLVFPRPRLGFGKITLLTPREAPSMTAPGCSRKIDGRK